MSLALSDSLRKSALRLAAKGKSVFPCKPDKSPYVRWREKATTDSDEVNALWDRHPEAHIGMPTGEQSGVFVVDVDRLAALEELPGELPETYTVRTRSGGLHYYFKHFEGIRNSTGELAEGIDIRGEGGYVIAPPSLGYRVEVRTPAADAPGWLIKMALGRPTRSAPRSGGIHRAVITEPEDTSPIHEGTRNITLTSIAGYLHDGSRDLAQLTGELLLINAARCTPPLEAEEIEGIASSIHRLEPCKKGRRVKSPRPEVIGPLRDILRDWWRAAWRGTSGKSDRDVLLAYILFALEEGTILPNGKDILIDVSHHQVAERARKSSSTTYNAHKRLKVAGWCRAGGNGPDRREDRPSGIVLLARSTPLKPERPNQGGAPLVEVFGFEGLPTARRGRHSAPGLARLASASRIAVIDYLERMGGWATGETVADALGVRADNARTRYLEPLEARGIVERCEEQRMEQRGKRRVKRTIYWWRLTEDWQTELERVFAEEEELERQLYGGLTADERQKKRREEARERYRNRNEVHPETAPSSKELKECQESYPDRRGRAIGVAIARLFAERPEYRGRRAGQITCALPWHLPEDFPQGLDGAPKDSEVEAILDGVEVSPGTAIAGVA